ncbi:MAG: RDD family protein [Actinomycetes bacterium]
MTAIRDPRAAALQGQQAGIVSRALADLIDFGVAQAVFFGSILGVGLIRYVLGADRRLTTWQPSTLGVVAVQYVLLVLVFAIGWGAGGRTLGKAILGLRVRRADGRPLGWGRALLRAGLCAAAPWILGFVALSRKNRGIHDVLLGTRVTYDWARGHV